MPINRQNRTAFLGMIAWAEGTSTCTASRHNGYDVIVGGTVFTDFTDHPRRLVRLSPRLRSTAAGRYQLLERYWDAYKKLLRLPDFSATSQDAVAIRQIKEQRALDDVDAGRVGEAIAKCANIWASLPGAGYGQREHNRDALVAVYAQCGGEVAA
ncbi:MAG: lysozyme [Methylobacter sp.]|nr:MAG: lysozyme [Methylobacter sp.]